MKKICIITGTRAEYGLLKPLMKKIDNDEELELQIIATGMHLSPEFGLTYEEIENDNFKIDEKIEILLSSDTEIGISKSMGLAMISFSESFQRLKPDMIVVLGDRYEIFAAVSVASVARIPIAHLHGGETTEGAFDEGFRHSITKMSYLHFTSTEKYRKRVIQLGENPERVYNVGSIGVESILTLNLLSKDELEKSIKFEFKDKVALVTFHPVTLEDDTAKIQFKNLLNALNTIKDLRIIFTKANSDTAGRIINKMIDEYASSNKKNTIAFISMGQLRYLSAMKYANIVIGNSSSGIIEAPSFKIPTVNIGDRQKGRVQSKTTINCNTTEEEIKKAIDKALSREFNQIIKQEVNPYERTNVSDKIVNIIKINLEDKIKLKKSFYDLER